MTLPVGIRGRLVALTLVLIPMVLLVRFAIWPVAESLVSKTEDLAITRSEITRYQRLLNQAPSLQAAVSEMEGTNPLSPYLLSGTNKALAAAGLQKHLQDAANQHGVTILSLRVKNPVVDGPFERISVEARLRSDNKELRDLLYFIETTRPYLFVEHLSVNVRRTRRRDVTQTGLDARVILYGLRAPGPRSAIGVING